MFPTSWIVRKEKKSSTLSVSTSSIKSGPNGSTLGLRGEPKTIPHVVIVGGGYAGTCLGRALEPDVRANRIKLSLVERRDSFHHKIGAIRASVQGKEYIERVRIPLKNIMKYSRIIEGKVVQVDSENDRLLLDDGSMVDYDILICATGTVNHSSGDLPPTVRSKDDIRDYFKSISSAIAESQRICIVGGGPTAVEFSGEIRSAFPNKEVTIFCSSTNLLSSCVAQPTQKFMKLLSNKLASMNIELIRGEKVIQPGTEHFVKDQKFLRGPMIVKTKGLVCYEREFDLVLWAATWQVNNEMYDPDWLNSCGELSVSDDFLVSGIPKGNVFAFGDICSISETKQAITLPSKVGSLRANIQTVSDQIRRGRDPRCAKLRKYPWSDKVVMYLPLGPEKGVSQVGAYSYTDAKTSKSKGLDLYTDFFWKMLTGNPPPPRPIES